HRLAEACANAASHKLLSDDVAEMRGPHVEDRGRAGREEIEQTEPHARAHRRLVVGGRERPHPRAEPSEERHVLRETAEERLTEMDVRLHDARHHDASRDVDDLGVRWRRDLADAPDASAAHQQVAPYRSRRGTEWQPAASAKQNAHA